MTSTGQGPYDGEDDTLVGIVNNSSIPITSIVLKSTTGIFGFDGDGIDTYGALSNTQDTTGYGGPNAYYTNISADTTTGTVKFITPVAAAGGTSYFSLENAIGSATACADLINNSIVKQLSTKNVCATFTPNQSYTLAAAAQVCGFTNFDWVQQITTMPDPSPYYARNTGGAFDARISGKVRLTSKRVQWNDPPQGGGYSSGNGGDATPDNSYPFYYDQTLELPGQENGTAPAACTLTATAGKTLTFHDAPSDGCLSGGSLNGRAKCTDAINAPGAASAPAGSFIGFQTHLAGVNFDGTATDLGIGFTWTSNNNGTTGGTVSTKSDLAADGNGTGVGTITSVTQIYQGLTVLGTNGAGGTGVAGKLISGSTCNGLYTGKFDGDITVAAGQSCMFVNGYITGHVRATGGRLELSGVLVGGNVHISSNANFTIGPSASIKGNLKINSLLTSSAQNQVCGSTVHGDLDFENNAAPVEIGSSSETTCVGNVIAGDLQVRSNSGATSIYDNSIKGDLHDDGNTGATDVSDNTVKGLLQCRKNTTVEGATNTSKTKEGQCAKF